jgi:hypothetical protein
VLATESTNASIQTRIAKELERWRHEEAAIEVSEGGQRAEIAVRTRRKVLRVVVRRVFDRLRTSVGRRVARLVRRLRRTTRNEEKNKRKSNELQTDQGPCGFIPIHSSRFRARWTSTRRAARRSSRRVARPRSHGEIDDLLSIDADQTVVQTPPSGHRRILLPTVS